MSRAAGKPLLERPRIFRVIEDQQPAVTALQIGVQRADRGWDLRRIDGDTSLNREVRELCGDQLGSFGGDPPHQVISTGEPVGVLHR